MSAPAITRTDIERWRGDFLAFATDMLTLADGRSYGDALDDWQEQDFDQIAHAGKHCWLERPRGHSKTMDAGAFALWHLLVTPDARAYVCAADRDQASLVYDSLRSFVRRSPLLASAFRLGKWEIQVPSTGARLDVLAADAAGSWGLRPSLVVLDELSRWRGNDAEELLYALHSSLGKVAGARMIVATTAGSDISENIAWAFRAAIMDDPAWHFSRRGQSASWIADDFLAEQKRVLPELIYAQVHENIWSETGVGALVTPEQFDACCRPLKPMRDDDRMPLVIGVDIGIRHDYTAVVSVSRDPDRRADGIAVRSCNVWEPPARGEVDLTEVDAHVRALVKARNVACIALDWWQAAGLAQQWREIAWVIDFSQGERRAEADTGLLAMILDKRLRHSGEDELRQAVLNCSGKVAQWENRIRIVKQHPRKRIDACIALSMAASECLRLNV